MSEHAIDAILLSPTPSPPSKRRHNRTYATSCDTDDVFEATMSHISVQESINSEGPTFDTTQSSSVHSQKKLRQSCATERMEWLERGVNGAPCKYCKDHARVNQSNKGTWIKIPYAKSKNL